MKLEPSPLMGEAKVSAKPEGLEVPIQVIRLVVELWHLDIFHVASLLIRENIFQPLCCSVSLRNE